MLGALGFGAGTTSLELLTYRRRYRLQPFEFLKMITQLVRPFVRSLRDAYVLGIIPAIQGARAAYGRGRLYFKMRDGSRIAIRRQNSDFETLRQVFEDKEYSIGNDVVEADIRSRYSDILSNGQKPVIIDAGANIGLATLWFKAQYPKATVISIEPDTENFAVLKENVIADNTTLLVHGAVGSRPGSVSLIQASKGWAVQTRRTQVQGINIITIDDAISLVPNGVPLIVKVDIEGFESDLFCDNLAWLDAAFAVFIEPHDWMDPRKTTSRAFQRAFGERDFNVYIRGEKLLYVRRMDTNALSSAPSSVVAGEIGSLLPDGPMEHAPLGRASSRTGPK
jgi:FkbM family methyltransferase